MCLKWAPSRHEYYWYRLKFWTRKTVKNNYTIDFITRFACIRCLNEFGYAIFGILFRRWEVASVKATAWPSLFDVIGNGTAPTHSRFVYAWGTYAAGVTAYELWYCVTVCMHWFANLTCRKKLPRRRACLPVSILHRIWWIFWWTDRSVRYPVLFCYNLIEICRSVKVSTVIVLFNRVCIARKLPLKFLHKKTFIMRRDWVAW